MGIFVFYWSWSRLIGPSMENSAPGIFSMIRLASLRIFSSVSLTIRRRKRKREPLEGRINSNKHQISLKWLKKRKKPSWKSLSWGKKGKCKPLRRRAYPWKKSKLSNFTLHQCFQATAWSTWINLVLSIGLKGIWTTWTPNRRASEADKRKRSFIKTWWKLTNPLHSKNLRNGGELFFNLKSENHCLYQIDRELQQPIWWWLQWIKP